MQATLEKMRQLAGHIYFYGRPAAMLTEQGRYILLWSFNL